MPNIGKSRRDAYRESATAHEQELLARRAAGTDATPSQEEPTLNENAPCQSQSEGYRCEKRLENGDRQCNAPATLFYESEAIGETSARCEEHSVIPYKAELGRLLTLTVEEFTQRRETKSR